jgi:hypothetical protein
MVAFCQLQCIELFSLPAGPSAWTGIAFRYRFASDCMTMEPVTTAERRTTMGSCVEYQRARIRPVQSSA